MNRARFPHLILLSRALDRANRSPVAGNLDRVLLVGVQHLLPTTGSLVQALLSLGLPPHNVLLQGKCYSTCPEVVERLLDAGVDIRPGTPPEYPGSYREGMMADLVQVWRSVRERLLASPTDLVVLLDDGGLLLTSLPKDLLLRNRFVGIEQTTSGLAELIVNRPAIPIIDVAGSAVKRILEPRCIGRAIVDCACSVYGTESWPLACGVIGLGVIGTAVANTIDALGHELIIYDHRPVQAGFPEALQCQNVAEVLRRSEVVIGCTGTDLLTAEDLFYGLNGNKVLASGSSGDVEFRTVIRHLRGMTMLEAGGPFDTRLYLDPRSQCEIRVLNGGFPVNFGRIGEFEPTSDIQITRCLLFGAIVQALLTSIPATTSMQIIQLNPQIQRFSYVHWADECGPPQSKAPRSWSRDWIQNRSGLGRYLADRTLENVFATH